VILLAFCGWAQTRESIEKQLKSVEQQRETIRRAFGVDRPPPVTFAAPAADCEPLMDDQATALIGEAAKKQALAEKLVRAVVEQESAFRPCAVSKHGALGLMQLMPATAEELEVEDPLDPKENIDAGTKFLRQLLEKFKGDLALSLAAYNAGPAAVEEAKGVPEIPETKDYVEAILRKMEIKRIDLPNIPTPKPIGN